MSDTSEPKRCPKCGAAIPDEAPQGLCPKCVLAQASIPTEGAKKQPAPTREEIAAAFPQLEILELIGQGGMGFVFKARQPKLERLVALKILPQALAADPAFAERFSREARLLARLNHPNIVAIHDFGQAGGYFYLLMEFVDGVNLRQAMRAGRFTPAQALVVVPKICEALQFAHDEGILHRDIKPENILVDVRGRVKIADFGIAKLVGDAQPEGTLTGSGATLGTPHYMAPEQLEKPGSVDHRADIYSLGVVFYEMLTGELPLGRFQPPSQKVEVDVRLDQVVLHALEKDPSRRYQHASQVRTAVETISSGPPPASVAARSDRFWKRMAVAMSLFCLALIVLVGGFAKLFLDARKSVASQQAASVPANRMNKESEPLVLVTVPPLQPWQDPGYRNPFRWDFKYLIPADHLAQVVFVLWSNGVPTVKPGFSGYFKVGPKPVNIDSMTISYDPHPSYLPVEVTNVGQWVVSPGFGYTTAGAFTNQPPLRKLETAPRSVLRSGDQLTIRLAEFDQPAGVASNGWSGVEIRWMLQPLSSPAVMTDPNELDRTNYVAGWGLAGAFEDSIMKMIKEIPIELQAAAVPANKTEKDTAELVIDTSKKSYGMGASDPRSFWPFTCLVPAGHLAQFVFVLWTNGIATIKPDLSGYIKVGEKPVVFENILFSGNTNTNWALGTNLKPWGAVYTDFNHEAGGSIPDQPTYRKLETASRSILHSGHQLAIRLAEFIQPANSDRGKWSGVEVRLILQPLSSPAVQTDPNEAVGTGYVGGFGLAGTSKDSIMKMINDLPTEPQAVDESP